jgi:alkanesulfonate monooxygenase SsuD/methylene tetrahydromethanopterin reductase-like flavin-dependent oxidoreductase (luciferase family)
MTEFGLVLPIQSSGTALDVLWEELRSEVRAAEKAGFDAVFLTEFHQARGGALVSPMLLGAGLLQDTDRIRFGSAVLPTPLHHPIRLAEDTLMLDWMTRGRVILGLGIGHQPPDFAAYGVDREARPEIFEEQLEILEKAFAGAPFEFHGKHFHIKAAITPAPYSKPRPPIWIGAHAKAGLERAARWADAWISDPQRDISTLQRLASHYRETAEMLGRPHRVALFREAWIADDRSECERMWAPHALAVHRLYYNVGVYRRTYEPWVDEVAAREDFTLDRLAPGRFLYGSGNDIRSTVQEWSDATGADYFALRLRHPGGPSHLQTLDAIARFGEEVIGRA